MNEDGGMEGGVSHLMNELCNARMIPYVVFLPFHFPIFPSHIVNV